jgi:pimeloyl-ACP methyl ester carboxylesterase
VSSQVRNEPAPHDPVPRGEPPVDAQPAAPVLACAAIDLPGFGGSPPPVSGSYSISAHALTVIRFIEKQGLGPVHLIATSMGGAISTRVAAHRPDLVRTLSLVSPALPDLPLARCQCGLR